MSLARSRPIGTLPLIEAITVKARLGGNSWGLFTATGPLVALLQRTGVGLMPLVPARPKRLPDANAWGRFCDTDPWLCALPEQDAPLRFMPRPTRRIDGAHPEETTFFCAVAPRPAAFRWFGLLRCPPADHLGRAGRVALALRLAALPDYARPAALIFDDPRQAGLIRPSGVADRQVAARIAHAPGRCRSPVWASGARRRCSPTAMTIA